MDMTEWQKKDATACHVILNTLPNTLCMHLMQKKTTQEFYETLKAMFESRLLVVGTELRWQLNKVKLKEGGDAHVHINKVLALHEELTIIGNPISEQDLFSIICAFLPHLYNPILSSISSTIKLNSKTVLSSTLLDLITVKYDHLALQDSGKLKAKSSNDTAFKADLSKKGKDKKCKHYTSKCGNCGWMGHWDKDCWEEGGGKKGQASKTWKSWGKKLKDSQNGKGKSPPKANTAEPDGVWLAEISESTMYNDEPANSWSVNSGNKLSLSSLSYVMLIHDSTTLSSKAIELLQPDAYTW